MDASCRRLTEQILVKKLKYNKSADALLVMVAIAIRIEPWDIAVVLEKRMPGDGFARVPQGQRKMAASLLEMVCRGDPAGGATWRHQLQTKI